MSKPYKHALSSVKKFGGKPEEFLPIHDWFDQTKSHIPDVRHRAILHSSFGIFLCEQVFGHNLILSNGKVVSVRDIGEMHVLEDLSFIPTMQDWLSELPIRPWMSKPDKKVEEMKLDDLKAIKKVITNDKTPTNPHEWDWPTEPIKPNRFDIID